MANLRRSLNKDLEQLAFREQLPMLLEKFASLLPSEMVWNSRKELLEQVYGYGLDQLHPDTSFKEAEIDQHALSTTQAKTYSSLGVLAPQGCLQAKCHLCHPHRPEPARSPT